MNLYYYNSVERHHLLTKRIIMMNDEKTGERGAGFFIVYLVLIVFTLDHLLLFHLPNRFIW